MDPVFIPTEFNYIFQDARKSELDHQQNDSGKKIRTWFWHRDRSSLKKTR